MDVAMRIRTKIVCTIGPACSTLDKMIALIEAGMSVARMNFSHATHEQHREWIEMLKEARKRTGKPLAIMLDTKGPEIRVGHLETPVQVVPGQIVTLVPGMVAEGNRIPVIPETVLGGLTKGTTVLFDDGYITSQVVDTDGEEVRVEIINEGEIRSGKGINIPNADLDMPLITDRDISDIQFGCQCDVDMVAASFVVGPEQILQIRKLLHEAGRPETQVIAKIETARGVEHFDQVLQVADGIMIARGDLGVEMPLAKVPGLQKMMIHRCQDAGKPSIVATQMLESMMVSSRPTRAEASDVANGIFDSASAVMLSGETAAGKYPIKATQMMNDIVVEAESEFDYEEFFLHARVRETQSIPAAVSIATLRTAIAADARAIFCISTGGHTPRLVSQLRPEVPILALTHSEKVYHQLAFEWGVVPIYSEPHPTMQAAFGAISKWALANDYVRYGDLVVLTAGVPYGVAGTTNMMIVQSIGDVAVRGYGGYGRQTYGQVSIIYDPRSATDISDRIVVLTQASDDALPLLKRSKGVILQNHPDDLESERYLLLVAKAHDLPVIVGAASATNLLREDEAVTVDPQNHVVYRGKLTEIPGKTVL